MTQVFGLSGDAKFSFGGGLGFQLQRLTLNGVTVLGHTLSLGLSTAPPSPPTAELALPYAGQDIDVATLNTLGYIEVQYTDNSGAGLNVSSITDSSGEIALTGTAAAGVTLSGVGDPGRPGQQPRPLQVHVHRAFLDDRHERPVPHRRRPVRCRHLLRRERQLEHRVERAVLPVRRQRPGGADGAAREPAERGHASRSTRSRRASTSMSPSAAARSPASGRTRSPSPTTGRRSPSPVRPRSARRRGDSRSAARSPQVRVDVHFAPGTWTTGGNPGAGGTASFTITTSNADAGSTSSPFSLGPLTAHRRVDRPRRHVVQQGQADADDRDRPEQRDAELRLRQRDAHRHRRHLRPADRPAPGAPGDQQPVAAAGRVQRPRHLHPQRREPQRHRPRRARRHGVGDPRRRTTRTRISRTGATTRSSRSAARRSRSRRSPASAGHISGLKVYSNGFSVDSGRDPRRAGRRDQLLQPPHVQRPRGRHRPLRRCRS